MDFFRIDLAEFENDSGKWQRAIEGAMILVAVISDHFGKHRNAGGNG